MDLGQRRQCAQVGARVLPGEILQSQYSRDEALATARQILFDTPQTLLGFEPRKIRSSRKQSGLTSR